MPVMACNADNCSGNPNQQTLLFINTLHKLKTISINNNQYDTRPSEEAQPMAEGMLLFYSYASGFNQQKYLKQAYTLK